MAGHWRTIGASTHEWCGTARRPRPCGRCRLELESRDQLAVARFANGECKSMPIGKVLPNVGYITDLRFSPQGDAIAFMDHPILGDDRGTVVLLSLQNGIKVVTPAWEGEAGLASSSDGKEVWFTATNTLDSEQQRSQPIGAPRLVLRTPGGLYSQRYCHQRTGPLRGK